MSKEVITPTFIGEVGPYEVTGSGVTAKRLNGEGLFYFEKSDSKPSLVKFKSSSDKGDIYVSIQYLKNGKKNNHPENRETRVESTTGNGMFDLSKLEDGKYVLRIYSEKAENLSFEYEFIYWAHSE